MWFLKSSRRLATLKWHTTKSEPKTVASNITGNMQPSSEADCLLFVYKLLTMDVFLAIQKPQSTLISVFFTAFLRVMSGYYFKWEVVWSLAKTQMGEKKSLHHKYPINNKQRVNSTGPCLLRKRSLPLRTATYRHSLGRSNHDHTLGRISINYDRKETPGPA